MIFWPITDEDDVRGTDWMIFFGTIHAFLSTLLFMMAEIVGLPLLLIAYHVYLHYTDDVTLIDLHIFLPILALWIAVVSSPIGPTPIVRLYLCYFQHKCSLAHEKVVNIGMGSYFVRVLLFSLFANFFAYFCFEMPDGCPEYDSVFQLGALWSCIKHHVTHSLLFVVWSCIAIWFTTGSWASYNTYNFVKYRYRGIWDLGEDELDPDIDYDVVERYRDTINGNEKED